MSGYLNGKWLVAASGAAIMAVASTPVWAQDTRDAQEAPGADIDRLIDAASSPDGAVTLARSQASEGDLTGAAVTLERALLDAPPQRVVAARLYYITVLCRLDDHERATIEVARLGGLKISDADLSEAQTACGSIQLPTGGGARSADGVSGNVTMGIAYDSDSYGALSTQFDLGLPAIRDDGFAFIASAQIDGRSTTGDGFLYGGLSALTKDSISGPSLDYQLATLRLGYGQQVGKVELSAGPVGRYARINGNSFLGEYGGQAEIALPGEGSRVALHGEIVHQDYAGSTIAFSRDGTRFDLALDYQGQPSAGLSWIVGAGFEDKTAQTAELGYTGGRVYAAVRLPIDARGSYAGVSTTIRHLAYRADLLGKHQIETRYFARAAIGTPISAGFDIEAAASYTRRDYNQSSHLLDYDNVGGELRLVWHFG
ncbi:MAG: hypothetical protein ABI240_16460 [Sphingomonas sp.]